MTFKVTRDSREEFGMVKRYAEDLMFGGGQVNQTNMTDLNLSNSGHHQGP